MKLQNLERQQFRAWDCISIPSGEGEGQELELPGECGLQPPGKRSGSGSESEEAAELQALGAEEAEMGLSPGDLLQLPKRGSILEEEWFAEETEEVEEEKHRAPHRRKASSRRKGQNSSKEASKEGELQCQGNKPSSNYPQRSQRRKAKATEPEGPWDLGKLQRHLQQNLDCGECGAQCLGSLGGCTVGREVGEPMTRAKSSDRAGLCSRCRVGLPNGPGERVVPNFSHCG